MDLVSEAVDQWLLIDFEVRRVIDSLRALEQLAQGAQTDAARDTESLLRETSVAPSDAASTTILVEQLRDQTNVLTAFIVAWQLWTALDGRQQNGALSSNPDTIYKHADGARTRDHTGTRNLLISLEEAREELADRAAIAVSTRRADHGLAPSLLPAAVGDASAALLTRVASTLPDRVSAATLIARVRTIDYTIAIVTAIVTALAYVLGIYANTQFGTVSQYLGAFAAGFLGQLGGLTINWALLSPAKASEAAASKA